ncbi:MAG: hypothetical protein KA802_11170 [Saprospiraceae bacterium]|nr:hypothetical protein [Saprospiraceae bacterium]
MNVWKRIVLGTYRNKKELLLALENKGISVIDSKSIYDSPSFQLSPVQKECDLIRISVRELGFNHPTLYQDICKKAQEIGLKLCPAEVAPQLKLQYKQPRGEYLTIGMELIEDRYFEIVFGFDYDIRFLRGNTYNPHVVKFELDTEFIFSIN